MQYNGIVRQEFDLAGKWRVWVNVGTTNTNLLMLKFQKEVSEDEIKEVVNSYVLVQDEVV